MLYILGSPGSGKSTLARALRRGHQTSSRMRPFAYQWIYSDPQVVELGQIRYPFGGTDTLSMSVLPRIIDQLRFDPWDLVLAEGDRLATRKFFDPVREMGYDLAVVYLDTPVQQLTQWRRNRGNQQDKNWMRSRVTKHRRLAKEVGAVVVKDVTLEGRLNALRELHHPVVTALIGDARDRDQSPQQNLEDRAGAEGQ